MRKTFTAEQKAVVALAALKGEKNMIQIAGHYEVHPTQVKQWAKQAQEGLPLLFGDKRRKENKDEEIRVEKLYQIIGQRDTELEWLKKKLQFES
jgi:putative transposase